jgi:hypothetical protein
MTRTLRQANHASLRNAMNGRADAMNGLEPSSHCNDTDFNNWALQ